MKERLSLTHDGVEMVEYPDSIRHNVIAAANAWKAFIALPDITKNNFAAATLQSDVGYEKKGSGERDSRDIKENFDITRDSLTKLQAQAVDNNIAATFISTSGMLFDSLKTMICSYGAHVQSTYGIEGFAEAARASADSTFVRFLYYPPTSIGTMIGEPHVDHSGFTFHLYESTAGCERLSLHSNEWLPMPVEEGMAIAFGGMQTQLFSHNDIFGLCHRIKTNTIAAHAGRIAIVCFTPLVHAPSYDRNTHGRLQDMPPGFNYTLSAKEFEQYFTH